MDGTDEIAIPRKMTRGPPRSDSVQWRYDRFVDTADRQLLGVNRPKQTFGHRGAAASFWAFAELTMAGGLHLMPHSF
jgi:hypothetical protein